MITWESMEELYRALQLYKAERIAAEFELENIKQFATNLLWVTGLLVVGLWIV